MERLWEQIYEIFIDVQRAVAFVFALGVAKFLRWCFFHSEVHEGLADGCLTTKCH